MNTRVKWISGMKMMATTGSGHQVPMDGPENFGGENSGSRPMEMLLMGLGGYHRRCYFHSRKDERACSGL